MVREEKLFGGWVEDIGMGGGVMGIGMLGKDLMMEE